MKYDESDNPLLRTTRFFTDKISDVLGDFIMYLCSFFHICSNEV